MSRSEQDGPLARKLESLLSRVQASATATPDPSLHHQLGDVYAELGNRQEALTHYGKAIDGFLGSGRVSVAVAICNKVVKRYPDVTRTHFTLACGAIHAGNVEEGMRSVVSYANAAVASATTGIAIPRLRFLAALFTDTKTRGQLGALLEQMGDEKAHEITHGSAPPEAATITEEKRRQMLLQLATWGSDAIWSGYWLKG